MLVILLIGLYTAKEISGTNAQKQRDRDKYRAGIFDALRAQDDGSLYTLIKSVGAPHKREETQNQGDDVAAATRTLMVWTAVLASATVLMAYFAYFTLDAIQGQLEEMRTASQIQEADVIARIQFSHTENLQSNGWHVTPNWKNIGKTDATNVHAWVDFSIIGSQQEANQLGRIFDQATPSRRFAHNDLMMPSDTFATPTYLIPTQAAWDTAYIRTMPILWGYLEYEDIFGGIWTQRYCFRFTFIILDWQLSPSLDRQLEGNCNNKTYKKHKT